MNCNYTAADGSEPFYVPAPIKNADRLQNYQTVLNLELFFLLSPRVNAF